MEEKEILTPQRVKALMQECITKEDDKTAIVCEGIRGKFFLNKDKLEKNKDEILAMLNELPDPFRETRGGGFTFLNACYDKNDRLWTGEQTTMEALFVLGMGIEKVKCLMPREMWVVLPGGMPYYVILDKGE